MFKSTVADSVRQYNDNLLVKNNVLNPNIIKVYTDIMYAVVVEMSVGDAKKMAKEPEVEFISYFNNVFELPPMSAQTVPATGQLIPWHIMRVGGPKDSTGSVVWVVDSGVDLSYQNTELIIDTTRAWTFSPLHGLTDIVGHGTAVAGVIGALNNGMGVVGVAPGATIIPVKVGDTVSPAAEHLLAGLDHVFQYGLAGEIVNISLCFEDNYAVSVINEAVSELVNNGLLVVVSAGNGSGEAKYKAPAGCLDAITVSAVDSNDEFCDFSNYGYIVDYAAPGDDGVCLGLNGILSYFYGTSMAAPHVAGLLASNRTVGVNGYAINDPDGSDDPIAFADDIVAPTISNLNLHYSGEGPSLRLPSSYIELTWYTADPLLIYPGETLDYTIERSLFSPTNFAFIGTTATEYYKDIGGIAEGKIYYYRVTAERVIYRNTYTSYCIGSTVTISNQ